MENNDIAKDQALGKLLELAALIEQYTVKRPELVHVAIVSLQNLKKILDNTTDKTAEQPGKHLQLNLEPVPQFSVPAEQNIDMLFDPVLTGFATNGTEMCFDELDSMQLAQVQNVPFLFHNNGDPTVF